jgi:hypothetical protein
MVELSLRTGIAPSAWAAEHPRTILTAIAVLNSEAQRAKQRRR